MSSGWWPSFSLPSSVQARFLSFALRKALGHLLLPGQLDVEQINSQIGRGYVQVNELRIDPHAVNAHINASNLPLELVSGHVSSVIANIPWPNPLFSTAGLTIEGLHLVFHLTSLAPSDLTSSSVHVVDSVASLSDSFIHEELSSKEEKQLRESLLQPEVHSQLDHALDPFLQDPSSLGALEDHDPAGIPLFTTLIERLLSRFQFDAKDLRVSVEIPDQLRLTLTIGQVTYRDDSSTNSDESSSKHRSVAMHDVKVLCTDLRVSPHRTPPTATECSPSPSPARSEHSEEDLDEQTEMMMSQSLAFLPPRPLAASKPTLLAPVTSSPPSSPGRPASPSAHDDDSSSEDGSMYQSALTGTRVEEQPASSRYSHNPTVATLSSPPPPEPSSTAEQDEDCKEHLIASFGPELIVATLITPLLPSRTIKLHIEAGALACALRPSHIALLSQLSTALPASPSASPSPPPSRPLSIHSTLTSKGIACLLLKDDSTLDPQFWAHPLGSKMSLTDTGYLKLSVSDVGFEQRDGETKASIRDVSLFGFEKTQDGMLPTPIVISDPTLLPGEDRSHVKDWTDRRVRATCGSKLASWRTKGKDASAEVGAVPNLIRVSVTEQGKPEVGIGPIQVFVDLEYLRSSVDVLGEFGAVDQGTGSQASEGEEEMDDEARERRRLERELMKDLGLDLDYTTEKTPKKRTSTKKQVRKPEPQFAVLFDFIRVQVRCPPPVGRKPRSGALVVDLESLAISDSDSAQARRARFGPSSSTPPSGARQIASVSCGKIAVGWTFPTATSKGSALPPAAKIATYITVSPLTDPETDRNNPLKPSVHLSKLKTRTVVRLSIPHVGVDIDKPGIDLLQYLADDVSQFAERFAGTPPDTSPVVSRNASVIGSRYFVGSLKSSGATLSQKKAESETVVEFEVVDVNASVRVPRSKEGRVCVLEVVATDLHGVVEIKPDGKDATLVSLTIMGLTVTDEADTDSSVAIVGLQKGRGMNRKSHPVVNLKFTSINIPHTAAKETRANVALWDLLVNVRPDVDQARDIAAFFKAPPGAFEAVVPSERTSVVFSVSDSSLRIFAPVHAGAGIIYLGSCSFTTDIVGGAEQSMYNLKAPHLEILFLDACSEVTDPDVSLTGREYWRSAGFAHLVSMMDLALVLNVTKLAAAQRTKVQVDQIRLEVHLCADTAGELAAFLGDVGSVFSPKTPVEAPPPRKRVTVLAPPKIDLMASIEDLAFAHAPQVGPAADMINDDLPTNPEYLDESFGAAGGLRELLPEDLDDFPEGEDYAPSTLLAASAGEGLISKIGGETIRMLRPGRINIEENHFNTLPAEAIDSDPLLSDARLQVRVREADFSLHLYEGYDWLKTRKAIEDETKDMRRKLARIKQLVAQGQTQDPSIESANTVLFNSVFIGLEEDVDELSPEALLVAIDKELDQDDDLVSQSSWQSFSPTPASGGAPAPPQRTKSKSKHLSRGKTASIEFHLRKAKVTFDETTPESALASRMLLTVEDLEILDRMKSSTWQKFLTELRSDSHGNVRETGSNMVRVELKKVRPVPGNPTEESRVRAKILPLRLYVDQDALDFLKKFFSFKDTNAAASPSQADEAEETYLQHVEVFPVDLKLDYKPRRVDYRALKEGRTIELMNFFHFDGAEMTLRHITANGILGWPRMFDLLNDLWTPDVKATQLVEVISGVAPIRSVVNVGSGVADLILLPIEQYKKDGRVVRGVQKGAEAFMRSTATEFVRLGARLATGTQVILEQAEDALGGRSSNSITAEAMFSPITEDRPLDRHDGDSPLFSRYAEQPADLTQGMQSAYTSLRSNLSSAAQTILAVPMEVYERQGDEGPVRSVIRAVPIAVIKPMIGATEAISKTLLGLHNTIDPNLRYENEAKYKRK